MTTKNIKILSIVISVFFFQDIYGFQSSEIKQFSEKLEQLKKEAFEFSGQKTGLIALLTKDSRYHGDVALSFLLSETSEINSY